MRPFLAERSKVNKPLVYVVTINWNGLEDTIECLKSLRQITYPNYRVIVVDNGSLNNQPDIIKERFPEIELIKNEKNEGFAAANNQGLEVALKNGADYALLLNNDTVVEEDFLDILVEYAKANNEVGAIAPKILYYGTDKIWAMGGKISYLTGIPIMIGKGKDSDKYKRILEPDFVTGCALMLKTEAIKKIGLLDAIYFAYYEDTDWCYQAKKAGYKIIVIPESIVWHKKSASAGIKASNRLSPTQAYLWARNGIIFGRKNLRGWKRIFFLIGQFSFRLTYNSIQCQDIRTVSSYLKGLSAGLRS